MNIVCIGAHPDDCEFHAGGTCVKWARDAHRVLLVSMTNGDIGHHKESGGVLARRRAREAQLSAERGGCKELILGYHDGELTPTLEARREVTRIIRNWRADVVLTHRPNDYHPDHRNASQIVQDAAFMVTVPNFCPETPRLERNPCFAFMMDSFQRPAPFRPDIAVAVDDVMDVKWDMLDAMESQVYEWLPWLQGVASPPREREERKHWLRQQWETTLSKPADEARDLLKRWYGKTKGAQIRYAELFEICEYGHQPSEDEIRRLFPFFPARKH